MFSVHSPRSLAQLSGSLSRLVEGRLWLQVLIGMFTGFGTGIALGPDAGLVSPQTGALIGNWLALPGRLFLTSIQMIVIPLVFASIIRGLAASGSGEQLRKVGVRVAGFFVATTTLGAAIGIGLAATIEPGQYVEPVTPVAAMSPVVGSPIGLSSLPERLIGVLPSNPLVSLVEGDMLQIVIFAFVVGIALVNMSQTTARPLLDLMSSLQEVCMTVVRWAMTIAPFAVFGLMAQLASRTGVETLLGLGVYVLTVLAGLLLMLIVYTVLIGFLQRQSPLRFLRAAGDVLLLAFSTSSSAAVMPLSMQTAQDKLGVRSSIAQFVIPLGATINMNGTALYQGVAALFLAQAYGVDVSTSGMVLVVTMAVGASIGSPATPGVGIVILSMILGGIGVPPEGVALIMGVDRVLDMCRTAVNVAGDLVACSVMERWIPQDASVDTAAAAAPA